MLKTAEVIAKLSSACPETEIRLNEPMSAHTSFRIGGPVSAMVLPKSAKEAAAVCAKLKRLGAEPFIMGNGTNLLVSGGEHDMIVVKMFDGLSAASLNDEDCEITAESGLLLSRIAVMALNAGLTGFEFAHGIPGSLGGAVYMDAGAYGGEMKDVIKSVRAVLPSGEEREFAGEDCGFSYRHSIFMENGAAVLSAVIKLRRGDPGEIKARMDELSTKRRESQPLNMPSAGSTFKRPKTGYAAALIEGAGLKGKGVGGAQVSEKHAGFVVNTGEATFDDVIGTMEMIKKAVFESSGVELEPEVRIIR